MPEIFADFQSFEKVMRLENKVFDFAKEPGEGGVGSKNVH